MLALISVLLLQAAGPRGPADFDQVIYLPRMDKATQFSEFLRVGGERTVLLRSENWREASHPLLRFDITRPETAATAGLDETQPLTLIFRGDLEVSCATVKNVERFTAACADRLRMLGTPFTLKVEGATLFAARDPLDRVMAGYVIKGNEHCAARMQGKTVEPQLKEMAKWLGKTPTTGTWKLLSGASGVGFLLTQRGVVSMSADGLTASATARGELGLSAIATGPGTSPYAGLSTPGILVAKLRADPAAQSPAFDEVATRLNALCPSCPAAPFKVAARTLAPTLTGASALVIARVKVVGSLRTDPGRFFSIRTVWFAETHSPEAALKAIMELSALRGSKPLEGGDGISVLLREGEVRFGVRGKHVFAANDPAVLETVYKALPVSSGTMQHGAEFTVDPKLLAQGLAQVPLMDAVQSTELAGALAAGTELGPLLLATDRIWGGADAQRAFLSWRLRAPPAAAPKLDAGVAVDAGAPADGG